MGSSLKKTYGALKNFGDLNELELEDSAWGFMAVETIIEVFEGRKARNDKRLQIAGKTGAKGEKHFVDMLDISMLCVREL